MFLSCYDSLGQKNPIKEQAPFNSRPEHYPLSIVHTQNMVYLPFRVIHLKHWEYSSPRFFGNQICCPVLLGDQLNVPDMMISCHPGTISQSTVQTWKGHRTQVYDDDPSFGIGPINTLASPLENSRMYRQPFQHFCLFGYFTNTCLYG